MPVDPSLSAWVDLGTFTDEELLVLTAPDEAGPADLVVFPHAARLDDDRRLDAERVAFRGLVARGVVESGPAPRVAGEVALLLDLRRTASHVLAARVTSGAALSSPRFAYVFVLDDVALLEDVDADGFHAFRLGGTKDVTAELGRLLVPPDAADGHAEVRGERDVLATVARAHVAADLVVRELPTSDDGGADDDVGAGGARATSPDAGPAVSPGGDLRFRQLFTGPAGCHVDGQGDTLTLVPMLADEVGAWAAGLVLGPAGAAGGRMVG